MFNLGCLDALFISCITQIPTIIVIIIIIVRNKSVLWKKLSTWEKWGIHILPKFTKVDKKKEKNKIGRMDLLQYTCDISYWIGEKVSNTIYV